MSQLFVLAILSAIFCGMVMKLREQDAIIAEQTSKMNEHTSKMAEHAGKMAEHTSKMADPDFNKRQAMLAFDSAEAWRREKVLEIYDNVTNQELDRAVRWISYAAPFAKERIV